MYKITHKNSTTSPEQKVGVSPSTSDTAPESPPPPSPLGPPGSSRGSGPAGRHAGDAGSGPNGGVLPDLPVPLRRRRQDEDREPREGEVVLPPRALRMTSWVETEERSAAAAEEGDEG